MKHMDDNHNIALNLAKGKILADEKGTMPFRSTKTSVRPAAERTEQHHTARPNSSLSSLFMTTLRASTLTGS